jgi:spore coat polysaccharide biosynthesis protein SpsF
MVTRFRLGDADVVTNARVRTFPRGLDAELLTRASLETMLAEASDPIEREHVTPYLYRHPERFRIVDFVALHDHSWLRLTLDTAEDYELLRRLHDAAPEPERLSLHGVLALLDRHPDWIQLNASVEQKQI